MESFLNKLKNLKIKHILIIILLASFFILCIANLITPDKIFSENENRTLAQFPEISFSDVTRGKYTENFDLYANDQFIGRDFFVSLKTFAEKLLLKKENNGILFADDDYLIERPDTTKKEIVSENLQAIIDFDTLDNFDITTCIVPTAFEILKDKLPLFSYNDSVTNLQKRIESDLNGTKIKISDVSENLRKRKDDYIYYRTDHHQTALGSYLVYKGLGESLGYEPYSEDSFEIKTLSDDFFGTTWSKTMLSSATPDKISSYKLLNSDTTCVIEYPVGNEKNLESFYDETKLNTKDKYSVYLGGVHPVQIVTSKAPGKRKLAIIKDSYAHSLVPFLANHFREIHLIDMRYYNGDVVEYLNSNMLGEVLILYNSATFMTDPSIAKLSTYSEKLMKKYSLYGPVEECEKIGDSYFDDALFLGDSLTDGLKLYSSLKGPVFVSATGVTVKGVLSAKLNDGSYIIDRLRNTPFKKVYIMLGINEKLGEENVKSFKEDYKQLIRTIREINPDAYIYLQSLLPVTETKSSSHIYVTNHNITLYNRAIKDIATKNQCYYLCVNESMMNEKGVLPEHASPDGVHLTKEYYEKWVYYLKTHAVSDGKATFDRKKATLSEEGQKLLEIAGKIEEKVSFDEDLTMIDIDSSKAIYPLENMGIKDMVVLSGSGATADEIAVFKITSKNLKQAIETVKSRIESRIQDFGTYIPKEVPKLKNPVIRYSDDLLIMVITNDYKNAEKIADDVLK